MGCPRTEKEEHCPSLYAALSHPHSTPGSISEPFWGRGGRAGQTLPSSHFTSAVRGAFALIPAAVGLRLLLACGVSEPVCHFLASQNEQWLEIPTGIHIIYWRQVHAGPIPVRSHAFFVWSRKLTMVRMVPYMSLGCGVLYIGQLLTKRNNSFVYLKTLEEGIIQ